ncbi:hypothetical protein ACVWXM_003322 [Bradyrhizobium sp. GM7.3]
MRKLILIAAMSLLASQAYAGGPRSLSLAATNASQQTAEPGTTAATPPQAPAAAPTNVQTATTAAASTSPGSDCDDNRDRSGRNSVQCRADCQHKRNDQAETSPAIHRGPRDSRTASARDLLVIANVVLAKARTHYPREKLSHAAANRQSSPN